MTPWQQQIIDRLPESLRNDPKKAVILGGLLVAFAGVLFIQFGRGGGGDSAAAATPEPTVAAPAPAPIPVVRPTVREQIPTAARVARWLETPAPALDRNVFALRLENFQSVAPAAQATAALAKPVVRVVEDELFWDELAKSLSQRADQRKQRQIWADNLAAAAGRIRVQTTIMGQTPVAMINGRRAGVGDSVEATVAVGASGTVAFRIVSIEARRVVVERDGLKFEILMTGAARVIANANE